MRHFYLIALATISVVSSSQAMDGKKKKKPNLLKSFMQMAQFGEDGKNVLQAVGPLVGMASTLMEKKLGQMDEKFAREGEKMRTEHELALRKIGLEENKADSEAKRVQSQIDFMQGMLKQSQQESSDKSKIIERLFFREDTK